MALAPAAILGGARILGGLSYGKKAKKEAARAAELERQRIIMQTEEEIRRRTERQKQEQSAGLVAAGVSGFGGGPTSGGYANILKAMQEEFGKEIDWLRRSAQAGIDVVSQQERSAKSSIEYGQFQTVLGGIADIGTFSGWWS
jgi:hypothetical protein